MTKAGPQHREAKADAEIEVTPQMIEAGATILYELEGEESREGLAALVYRAMAAAAPGHSRNVLKDAVSHGIPQWVAAMRPERSELC